MNVCLTATSRDLLFDLIDDARVFLQSPLQKAYPETVRPDESLIAEETVAKASHAMSFGDHTVKFVSGRWPLDDPEERLCLVRNIPVP